MVEKLHSAETYWIAGVVGTLINGYGQLLVPWARGSSNPFDAFADEFRAAPALTVLTITLAYLFPLAVGITSSVFTRYLNRRVESIAEFPERKPDPVFRARRDGSIAEVGAATLELFRRHDVSSAQDILGDAAWAEIVAAEEPGRSRVVFFRTANQQYVVSHSPSANDQINVYMTPLPAQAEIRARETGRERIDGDSEMTGGEA